VSPEGPSPARQLVKHALTAALPRSALLVNGPADRQVCLTFDDGPHPLHTPRLLDVLAQLGLRATFFVVGARVAEHPALVRRIVDEGHVLGGHSYSHAPPPTTGASELAREVRRTGELVASIVGGEPTHFRPPHGKLTGAKLLTLWAERQSVVLWSVDPKDFARRDAGEVAAFFEARPLRGGDLVLLHDSAPYAAAVLPGLADSARRAALRFATVDAWTGRNALRRACLAPAAAGVPSP
jgi:peptidoglycan-N-acetylglucosamine deacetylase